MSNSERKTLLAELARILQMTPWQSKDNSARFILEGGGVEYILDAEESESGLLLGLGIPLHNQELYDATLAARALAVAQREGLRALRHEGCLYFSSTVPADATADIVHRTLETCLLCHGELRAG